MKDKHKPELLAGRAERSLRIILRAIAQANEDRTGKKRTVENRVRQAEALLLGDNPPRGASPQLRDGILEMMSFYYSVEVNYKKSKNVSIESIARSLLVMPDAKDAHSNESLIKDLVRKFIKHKDELLTLYSYDSTENGKSGNFEDFYLSILEVLTTLERFGIKVEFRQIPPGSRQGRNTPHITPMPAPEKCEK